MSKQEQEVKRLLTALRREGKEGLTSNAITSSKLLRHNDSGMSPADKSFSVNASNSLGASASYRQVERITDSARNAPQRRPSDSCSQNW
jgi:hypothetical protein